MKLWVGYVTAEVYDELEVVDPEKAMDYYMRPYRIWFIYNLVKCWYK